VFSSWGLCREYGFVDADGRKPMWDEHFAAAFGHRYPAADEASYASWRDGPFELSQGDGYPVLEEPEPSRT
jgi:hypothetical protein